MERHELEAMLAHERLLHSCATAFKSKASAVEVARHEARVEMLEEMLAKVER